MRDFWENGLQFTCTQCGKCCCGEPGIVYFSQEEFERLAAFLKKTKNISRETLVSQFMRPYRDAFTARDDFPDGHCIFFDHGCTVYEVRPSQCRDFPFWRCNLRDINAWNETAKSCPGMNHGKHWTADEICEIASKSRI